MSAAYENFDSYALGFPPPNPPWFVIGLSAQIQDVGTANAPLRGKALSIEAAGSPIVVKEPGAGYHYLFGTAGARVVSALLQTPALSDVSVKTDFLMENNSSTRAGVILRYQDNGNYYAGLLDWQSVFVYKVINGAAQLILRVDHPFVGLGSFEFKATGNKLEVFGPGNAYGFVLDNSLASGQVGLLGVNQGQWGGRAFFDNVSVVPRNLSPIASICPLPPTTECTAFSGTAIALDGSCSTDPDGAEDIVKYEWDLVYDGLSFSADASGMKFQASFPLGQTPVGLRVMDSVGHTSIAQATVTVVDTTPPKITCPPEITAMTALGQTAFVVQYPAPSATDNCGVPTVSCAPPSGSSFAVGATTVTCTATDASANTATCIFTVTVLTPQAATQLLVDAAKALVSQGVLNEGQGNALMAKLQAAIQSMDKANATAAVNQLQAFINEVIALMKAKKLSDSQGQTLIAAAQAVINQLGN